jgi:hypothetical protein
MGVIGCLKEEEVQPAEGGGVRGIELHEMKEEGRAGRVCEFDLISVGVGLSGMRGGQ